MKMAPRSRRPVFSPPLPARPLPVKRTERLVENRQGRMLKKSLPPRAKATRSYFPLLAKCNAILSTIAKEQYAQPIYEERSSASRSIVCRSRTDPLAVVSRYCDLRKRSARVTLRMGVPLRHAALVTCMLYIWLNGIEKAPQRTEARKSPPVLTCGEMAPLVSAPTIHCSIRDSGSEMTRIPAIAAPFRSSNAVKPGPVGIIGRTGTVSRPADAWLCISCAFRVLEAYVMNVSVNAPATTAGAGLPRRLR